MTKQELLTKIKKAEIVKSGQFKLRSGITSNLYLDVRKLFGDPNLLFAISDTIRKILPDDTTCIAGSGYGGLPLATAVALASKVRLAAVRNETKGHGIKKSIEGHLPNKNDKIVIVDDLFTTGSSILSTVKELKKTGAKIIGAVVVIKRAEPKKFPIPLQCLFALQDILN
jgi:orotate phosphoribosyltransferase